VTNSDEVTAGVLRHSGFGINSSFVIRHSSFRRAFTLIELIVVVGIIAILAALVLSTVGYARKKAARARAETEIAAMSAACENYKADNGIYVRGPAADTTVGNTSIPMNATDVLNAKQDGNPISPSFGKASLYLYTQLSGDSTGLQQPNNKSYFMFKPQMLVLDTSGFVTAIKDPFGNSYGYSTIQAGTQDTAKGYNPTFDLWSTSGLTATPGGTPDTITPQWVKNW
jgi:prepilin-type N-terminal cleavage/methylation domain-containing protein